MTQHEILPSGEESTEKWAIREPGFLGSIMQIINCARCGILHPGGRDTPMKYRDIGKPTIHLLCDDCYEALPE